MGPISATFHCLTHPFAWDGRATRSEYWGFAAVHMLFSLTLLAVLLAPVHAPFVFAMETGDSTPLDAAMAEFARRWSIASIAMLWPALASLAASIRRLHDTGRSGWWFLINLLPLIGPIWFFVLTVLGSEPRGNLWGPAPAPSARQEARRAKAIDAYMPARSEVDVHDTPEAIRALRLSRMEAT